MSNDSNILKKMILFMLLVAGMNGMFSWLYYQKFAHRKPYFKQEKNFELRKKAVETLILGHSRAAFGINDSILGGAFNFATYGENNVYTYYKLSKLIEENPGQIKRIIIPIGLSTYFSNSRPNMADHSYWNRYIDYYQLGVMHEDRSTYLATYLQSKVIPYAKMLRMAINKKDGQYKKEKIKLSALKTHQEKYQLALESVSHNFEIRNYYDHISLRYLNTMLVLCAKHNIEVIPIRFPVTPYYLEAFADKMEEKNINEMPFLLTFKNHGITIWNEEKFFGNDETKFKDVHHLTPEASIEFTLYVKQKLSRKASLD